MTILAALIFGAVVGYLGYWLGRDDGLAIKREMEREEVEELEDLYRW